MKKNTDDNVKNKMKEKLKTKSLISIQAHAGDKAKLLEIVET